MAAYTYAPTPENPHAAFSICDRSGNFIESVLQHFDGDVWGKFNRQAKATAYPGLCPPGVRLRYVCL